ncbi:MAG: prephenate dehydratase [Candidatus Omnitrophota bacterium]
MERLEELRKRIDQIDDNILRLLNERASITLEIGALKSKKAKPSFSPYREAQVYARLEKTNKGPLQDEAIKAIYREIMSAALSLQNPPKVAYLGPEATFTHLAALGKFGKSLEYAECSSIGDVFTEVERGRADYGVVPIENSTEGAVNYTLDMFIDSELRICSEAYLPIEQNLLSKNPRIDSVKKVYSHIQVFPQCRIWLEKNLPKAALIPCASTTAAAMEAAADEESAAIASAVAAEKYNLNILARSIEDSAHNITRFLIIGKQDVERTGNDRTSIVFSMKDKIGALHDVLMPFKEKGINLTKIESRPSKKKAWKYYFFVDLEGHLEDVKVRQALAKLEKNCTFFKVLGAYPIGK